VYFSFVAGAGFVVAGLKENYFSAMLFLLLLAFLFEAVTADMSELESVYLVPVYLISFFFGFSRKRGYLPFFDLYFLALPFVLGVRAIQGLFGLFQSSKAHVEPQPRKNQNTPYRAQEKTKERSDYEDERKRRAEEIFKGGREDNPEAQPEEKVDTRSPEEILGLASGYTHDDARVMHKKLMRDYHVDKFVDMPQSVQDAMTKKSQSISMAYNTLKKQNGWTK
jgi:hypothetical protein